MEKVADVGGQKYSSEVAPKDVRQEVTTFSLPTADTGTGFLKASTKTANLNNAGPSCRNLTLLTKEHFEARDFKKISPQSNPVLFIYTDVRNTAEPFRNETRWATSQTRSISWARDSQSNNKLQPTVDNSYTRVLQARFRESLWVKFAGIPGCGLIPWQHDVTVLPCGSAWAAYSFHTLITTHLRERTCSELLKCTWSLQQVYEYVSRFQAAGQ